MNSVSLIENNDIIINFRNISLDMAAGIICAYYVMNLEPDLLLNGERIHNALNLKISQISKNLLQNYLPETGFFGIWIKNNFGSFDLYTFKTFDFIKGFVTLCDNFSVDFRDYILSMPFDSNGNEYGIENYDILSFNEAIANVLDTKDLDAPGRPFYTSNLIYEADANNFDLI